MSSVIQMTSVSYPESDGKPMGETDQHRKEMIREMELLGRFFEGQQVYVSGDLLVYYEQGNPKKFVVPDVFVVLGLEPRDRRIYKLWVERKAPNVVIEVTSRKTKKKDTVGKPALYAKLGIREYFLFDPTETTCIRRCEAIDWPATSTSPSRPARRVPWSVANSACGCRRRVAS